MKQIAIYQNTFTGGGRVKVIAAMTYVINEMGITPDWICFRNTLKEERLKNIISRPVNVKFKLLRDYTKGLSEDKYICMNQRMSKLSKQYDLVINSNNTIAGYLDLGWTIHYIHFPREARLLEKYYNSTIQSKIIRSTFRKLYSVYSLDRICNGMVIANSEFTKTAMLDVYPLDSEGVSVIYPPIDLPLNLLLFINGFWILLVN